MGLTPPTCSMSCISSECMRMSRATCDRSRCRCGRGEPGPGADVAGVGPSPGADVARANLNLPQLVARHVRNRIALLNLACPRMRPVVDMQVDASFCVWS